jgi:hypothetical protein
VEPTQTVVHPQPPELSQYVEVQARIPHASTRVAITVDVEPRLGSAHAVQSVGRTGTATFALAGGADFALAGGRTLPPLIFLTNRDALRHNVGAIEADAALDAIRRAGHIVEDGIPPNASAKEGAPLAQRAIATNPGAAGVVLLGGYDVVPPEWIDALPERLRARLDDNDDPDDFVVLSDDIYGDRDGDGISELPVSRIPDGRAATLLHTALAAPASSASAARAIRNFARPLRTKCIGA